jgi:hypothetical protein
MAQSLMSEYFLRLFHTLDRVICSVIIREGNDGNAHPSQVFCLTLRSVRPPDGARYFRLRNILLVEEILFEGRQPNTGFVYCVYHTRKSAVYGARWDWRVREPVAGSRDDQAVSRSSELQRGARPIRYGDSPDESGDQKKASGQDNNSFTNGSLLIQV